MNQATFPHLVSAAKDGVQPSFLEFGALASHVAACRQAQRWGCSIRSKALKVHQAVGPRFATTVFASMLVFAAISLIA